MTETRLLFDAWADQDPHRRGWLARYQTDKGVNTVMNPRARRAALLYPTEQAARSAADAALRAHLNANPRPRSSGAKTFAVARNGRNVRTISLPRS